MEMMAELIQSSESIILREVLKIISESQCNGYRQFFKVIASGLGKVMAMFVIQYYLKNTDRLPSILFSLFKTFFYKTKRLDMSTRELSLYVARRLESIIKNNFTHNCFPLEFHSDNGCGVVEYLPFVHDSLFREVESRAQKDFNDSQSSEFSTLCHALNGDDIKPKKLFPSRNYRYLDDVVSSYFKVAEMTEIFSTKGILIDGEPGLGKTGSVEYLASLNKYGRVIKIDMTNQLDVQFKDIVKKVKQKNKETLIVLFDELDKYISHVIRLSYETKRSEHDPKKCGILPTWNEHVSIMKEKFLFELLGLLENSYFDKGAIFIFCSNNFDTIFNGVEHKHFESFKKRFLPINFHRCGCEELKDYIRYYNDKFANSDWFREKEILDRELGRLREDIFIPYRDINDLNISSCYRVEKFIDSVNEWQQQDDEKSESSLSDLFFHSSSDQEDGISTPEKENDKDKVGDDREDDISTPEKENDKDGDDRDEDYDEEEWDDEDEEEYDEDEDYDEEGEDSLYSVTEKKEVRTGEFLRKDYLSEKKDVFIAQKENPTEIKKETVECVKDEYLELLEPSLTTSDEKVITGNIKRLLDECQNTSGKENKARIALEMFTYLSGSKCHRFMKDHEKFGITVLKKLQEMKADFEAIPKYSDRFEVLSETIARRLQ